MLVDSVDMPARESVKISTETYRKVMLLKSKAEEQTREPFTIGRIIEEAVDMALEHVEEGLASWKRKR
jgi:hypothetical protein